MSLSRKPGSHAHRLDKLTWCVEQAGVALLNPARTETEVYGSFRAALRVVAGLSDGDAEAYVMAAWPDILAQVKRVRLTTRPIPKPVPKEPDPMKLSNPLLLGGSGAKPQPAPEPEPPLATASEPAPAPEPAQPKPAGKRAGKRDLATALAAVIAEHAAPAELDEARVIALIREHGQAQPGLKLDKPDQPTVTYDKPLHAYAPLVVALIHARVPLYIWSGSGTSKTRLVEAAAELLKLPYYSDSYTRGMGRAEILGFRDAHGNAVDTQLSQAFTSGGLYLADEADADGVGVIAMNRVLANDHAVFAGRLVKKHPDFRLAICANTPGTGQANGYRREPIDAALLDRVFMLELPVDERLEWQAANLGGDVPKGPSCKLDKGRVLEPEEWGKLVTAYRRAAKELNIGTPLTTSGRPLWLGAHLCRHGIGADWLIDGLIRKSRPEDSWKPWRERAESYL